MKTYQDLLECGQDEKERIAFIQSAIAEHKRSVLYQTAATAQLYYNGENPTINQYEKILYDMQGLAHRDMYTANHKIASSFFGFAVDQVNSYLLGNGVAFKKKASKSKLGRDFDRKVSLAAEYALIGGVSFGFWNLDHIDVFEITEFVPLYDEENGSLSAGVRFWQIDSDKPLRCTLYEPDSFTEYIQRSGRDMTVLHEKRPYVIEKIFSELKDDMIYYGKNYPSFPIVPLKNNQLCLSELTGKRNTIDALDLASSNMVNNVDEGNLIYWVLTNCDGMSDIDDAKFIEQLKLTHVAHAGNGDGEAKVEAHTIEAPYTGTQTTIDMLQKKLYQDFQALDTSDDAFNSPTATGLKFRYAALDLKTDKFERQVTEFISGILGLAGIDDEPSYTRNKIVNTQEEVQTVLLCAEHFDDEYTTRKLLAILGDADLTDEILKRRDAEDLKKFDADGGDTDDIDNGVLNASKTSSLISVIKGVKNDDITEEQAVKILELAIGMNREEALAILHGNES